MAFFTNCKTLEDLKALYKKLALKWHPDRGGDTATMQAINGEYEAMFERLKYTHKKADGTTWKTKYTNEQPREFIDLINWLLHLQNITIEVIGCFVWLTGNTLPYKKELAKRGFKWSPKKSAWYLAPKDYRKTGAKIYTLDEIRDAYGVRYKANANGVPELEGI